MADSDWWIAVVNLAGITRPVLCNKKLEGLDGWWDRSGDWDAKGKRGTRITDGCIQFESKCKLEVEAFISGARAVGYVLKRYSKRS